MVFVSDSDMKSPLVVLINDFSGPNSPFVIAEGSPKTVEVVWAATKNPFRVTVTIHSDYCESLRDRPHDCVRSTR